MHTKELRQGPLSDWNWTGRIYLDPWSWTRWLDSLSGGDPPLLRPNGLSNAWSMESLAMTGRAPEPTLLRSRGRICFWI